MKSLMKLSVIDLGTNCVFNFPQLKFVGSTSIVKSVPVGFENSTFFLTPIITLPLTLPLPLNITLFAKESDKSVVNVISSTTLIKTRSFLLE